MTMFLHPFRPQQRERKFLLDAASASQFWQAAQDHLQPARENPGDSVFYARTTYFDTPGLSYYRTAQSSSISRRIRVREYARADNAEEIPAVLDRCYLELKQSSGGLRSKFRIPMSHGEISDYLSCLSDEPLIALVTSRYRRKALTDDYERVRVTLDDRIEFCRPCGLGEPFDPFNSEPVIAQGPPFVLEIKLHDEPEPWLQHALDSLNEAIGFSKFTSGMVAAERSGLFDIPDWQALEASA